MGATTTQSIKSTRKKIIAAFDEFTFATDEVAHWNAALNTVFYENDSTPEALYTLLHELGHAVLGHTSYRQDVELLSMERTAWQKATEIATNFEININPDFIEETLDSYRDWLHLRSRCPNCNSAGIQRTDGNYYCVLCEHGWRANEAKTCGLKRYSIKK